MSDYFAIDLFSGCGGLTQGLKAAGFRVIAAFERDADSIATYQLNHPKTKVFEGDIREVKTADIQALLKGKPLHLLAGCPPCQGFSSMRRLNKKRSRRDDRNNLVLEYLRFVRDLKPLTIMMENVPGLVNYTLFKRVLAELHQLGYSPTVQPVRIQEYGVPQRRRRLVLVGSLLGNLEIAEPTNEKATVRKVIGRLESPSVTKDPVPVQPEQERRRFPLVGKFRPSGGDFQGIWVYRSDVFWGGARRVMFRARLHRLDEPTGLSLGMVASLQSPLPFHPAKSL